MCAQQTKKRICCVVEMFWIIFLLNLNYLSYLVDGACPNYCNRHGSCNDDNVCICSSGFSGADCSQGNSSFMSSFLWFSCD